MAALSVEPARPQARLGMVPRREAPPGAVPVPGAPAHAAHDGSGALSGGIRPGRRRRIGRRRQSGDPSADLSQKHKPRGPNHEPRTPETTNHEATKTRRHEEDSNSAGRLCDRPATRAAISTNRPQAQTQSHGVVCVCRRFVLIATARLRRPSVAHSINSTHPILDGFDIKRALPMCWRFVHRSSSCFRVFVAFVVKEAGIPKDCGVLLISILPKTGQDRWSC